MPKKTREEVDALIGNWKNDPCWDIEDTEGFEEYYDELLELRLRHEKLNDEAWAEKVAREAERMGETNLALVEYIMNETEKVNAMKARIEREIERLRDFVERVEQDRVRLAKRVSVIECDQR